MTNRDQFASTSVNIEVTKKSRNLPKFERERYEAYVYSNSGPENMVLRDRTSNRPFRLRARDDDFANVGCSVILIEMYSNICISYVLNYIMLCDLISECVCMDRE